MLPPSVPVRPSNSHGLVLLAVLLGLVLGATAVGMIWFVSGRSASATEMPPTDASTHATAACADLAGHRLAEAVAQARTAQAEDPRFTALFDALHTADVRTGHRAANALVDAGAASAEW